MKHCSIARLTLKQIFQAKVWASFLLSMLVSLISFTAMFLVMETELFFLMGRLLIPGVSWLVIMLLLSPAISLIAVTLIVRGSAKAQSVEESQQAAVFHDHSAYSAYNRTVYRRPINECLDSSRTRCSLRNTRLDPFTKIYGAVHIRKAFAIEKSSVQRCIEPSFYSTCSIKSSSTPAASRQAKSFIKTKGWQLTIFVQYAKQILLGE